MSTPGKKTQLPFKAMDIKTAFQTCPLQKRKRKAPDTEAFKIDAKIVKISDEITDDKNKGTVSNDKCIIDNSVSQKDTKFTKGSDETCKVLKDNVQEDEQSKSQGLIPNSINGMLNDSFENDIAMNSDNGDDSKIDTQEKCADDSISLVVLSSDEDSSVLNTSSLNVSLNTSLNVTVSSSDNLDPEGTGENLSTPDSSPQNNNKPDDKTSDIKTGVSDAVLNGDSKDKDTPKQPKKRRKMSPEEAQLKTEQRIQKLKEKEIRKLQKVKELLAKKEEKQKRQMEREEALKEKQRKKDQDEAEKKEREKQKQEKKDQEEKDKQRKLQEKEEKNRIRQQILESKAEEKKKKEELRQKAIEEKTKAEEEKKRIEMEKEMKKTKTQMAFKNFFVKGDTHVSPPGPQSNEKEGAFLPFQVSDDMILAPIIPPAAQERFDRNKLEHLLGAQDVLMLYIDLLKSGRHKDVRHRKKNSKEVPKEEGVIIVDEVDQAGLGLKSKLFQFCDNIRPPYRGTWRKKSKCVRPRNPFAKDDLFDYEVDSDDEWDEGGPGESLSGTEDEESEDDYEVDNEFFVPHGYLSADEEGEDDNPATKDPEEQLQHLKLKEREFMREKNKKTTELKPIIMGCFFQANGNIDNSILEKSLQIYCAEVIATRPIQTIFSMSKLQVDDSSLFQISDVTSPSSEQNSQKHTGPKRPVPEEAMPYLIQLLHANTNSRQNVVKEFQEFWHVHCRKMENGSVDELKENATPAHAQTSASQCGATTPKLHREMCQISKRQLDITIQKISNWCRSPNAQLKKYCWWVNDEVLQKYGLTDSPVPNRWNYVSYKDTEDVHPTTQPVTPSIKVFMNQ